MQQLCTREEALSLTKRRFKTTTHPTFGVTFRLRNLTEREKTQYETAGANDRGLAKEKLETRRRRLIVATAVDGDGNPIFTPADLKGLEDLDGAVTSWLYSEAYEHCNLDASLEDAEKNSEATGESGSSTA